jgi:hypothetical protein
VTKRKINVCYHEDELIDFWQQNKEAHNHQEAEERREIAFFHRRAMEVPNPLSHQLCEYLILEFF